MPTIYTELTDIPGGSWVGHSIRKDGSISSSTPGSMGSVQLRSFAAGQSVKGYRKLLAAGKLIPFTPYHKVTHGYQPYGRSYGWRRTDGTSYRMEGDLRAQSLSVTAPYFATFDRSVSLVRKHLPKPDAAELLLQAAARVYEQGYDLSTALAESGQTITMVIGLVSRAKSALMKEIADIQKMKSKIRNLQELIRRYSLANDRTAKFRRQTYLLRLRRLQEQLKRLANGYLEARYGWRPLLNDIKNLQEVQTTFDSKRTLFCEHASREFTTTFTELIPQSGALGTWDMEITYDVTLSTRATVSAIFHPDKFRVNVPQTAWELVTLSFVVDWFYSVGDAIAAASLKANTDEITSCYSTKLHIKGSISSKNLKYAAGVISGHVQDSATLDLEILSRTPMPVPSKPVLVSKTLSKLQLTDLAALLVQRTKLLTTH